MAFDNFTVNVVSFIETAGTDWTIANPSVSLTITPDAGYAINAINFSPIAPLPTYVGSVVFTQNGLNIDCVITYTSPSIMPSVDVLISLCIQGYAERSTIVISGVLKGSTSNVSIPASGDLPRNYSGSGEWDTSLLVLTQVVTASTGYFFATLPVLSLSIGNLKNYTITSIKTFDAKNRLIQVVFSVSYKFPEANVTGDLFVLTANAVQYPNPLVKIVAYQFNSQNVIQQAGETRTFTIYGIEGANWALIGSYTPGNVIVVNASGVIDATGQAVVSVVFPATTNVNRTFTFTLTGDLAASFNTANGQTSTPSVIQYVQSSLSLVFTSTNAAITVGPAVVRYYLPYTGRRVVEYIVTATSTQTLTVANNPTPAIAWSGQGTPTPPVDYDYEMTGQTFVVNNLTSPSTLTATIIVDVSVAGAISKTSTLDLDNVLI